MCLINQLFLQTFMVQWWENSSSSWAAWGSRLPERESAAEDPGGNPGLHGDLGRGTLEDISIAEFREKWEAGAVCLGKAGGWSPRQEKGGCGLWRIGHLITSARLASISPVIPTVPFPGSAMGLCPGKFHARPHAAEHLLGFPLENFSRSSGIG